jgi:hypothetical protein
LGSRQPHSLTEGAASRGGSHRSGLIQSCVEGQSDRYRRLDNIEIATKLLPEFGRLSEEVEFHNASITDERSASGPRGNGAHGGRNR